MPIGPKTLKQHNRKHIVLTGDQTISDVLEETEQKGYEPNQTYLVVKNENDTYQVVLLSDLERAFALIGVEIFDAPLSQLPIPEAQRVVSVDTPESSGSVLEWVSLHPQSTLVVVGEQDCVGVFSNPNRSGVVEDRSLWGLHGRLLDLYKDYRRNIKIDIAPPHCPICDHQNFFKFDPKKSMYVCPSCGTEIKQR